MSALLITALVGLVIPALVALVTKESLPPWAKALILLLLSTASGVLSGVVGSPPATWAQWQAVLVAIVVTFVTAAASQYAVWAPDTGAFAHLRAFIDRRTGSVGIGRRNVIDARVVEPG
jgi:hypothetical protein